MTTHHCDPDAPCDDPTGCGICEDCDELSHSDDDNPLYPTEVWVHGIGLRPGYWETRYLCKTCIARRLDGPSAADLAEEQAELRADIRRGA